MQGMYSPCIIRVIGEIHHYHFSMHFHCYGRPVIQDNGLGHCSALVSSATSVEQYFQNSELILP